VLGVRRNSSCPAYSGTRVGSAGARPCPRPAGVRDSNGSTGITPLREGRQGGGKEYCRGGSNLSCLSGFERRLTRLWVRLTNYLRGSVVFQRGGPACSPPLSLPAASVASVGNSLFFRGGRILAPGALAPRSRSLRIGIARGRLASRRIPLPPECLPRATRRGGDGGFYELANRRRLLACGRGQADRQHARYPGAAGFERPGIRMENRGAAVDE
jgi:hypothetical protein